MDDASSVRRIQCVSDVNSQRQYLIDLHRTIADTMLQRHSVQKFHDDERVAVVVADLINGADVGMVECGSGTRFPAKTLQRERVLGLLFRKKFQGDETAEFGVLSLVDDTHPSTAQ